MRKLLQSVLISVDGVVTNAGQWAMPFFNEESTADAVAQLDRSDAMLFGRLTFQELSQQWASAPGPFAERLRVIKKYVFSATLHDPAWANTVVVRTDPVQAVRELKDEGQGDLTIYGYGRVAQTLLDSDLVDELTLSIHPVVVGAAAAPLDARPRQLRLLDVTARSSGVLVARYGAPDVARGRPVGG